MSPRIAACLLACAALSLVRGERAGAARSDFVGAEACGSCHQEIFRAWKETAHARAEEVLGGQRSSRRCQACHSTGEAPAGPRYFRGVQCEACHGPGAGYQPEDVMRDPALARALGLRELSTPEARAALCLECHRAETGLTPFDPAEAWRRIAH